LLARNHGLFGLAIAYALADASFDYCPEYCPLGEAFAVSASAIVCYGRAARWSSTSTRA
jgi:hypothetical protein